MLRRIKKWFGAQRDPEPWKANASNRKPVTAPRKVQVRSSRVAPTQRPPANEPSQGELTLASDVPSDEAIAFDAELRLVEEVDSLGPGKNVLSHRTLYRVETGTYETLQLVDGPAVEEPVETVDPYDPYNTGSFDQWEKPRRK